jgi:hypothetical protein
MRLDVQRYSKNSPPRSSQPPPPPPSLADAWDSWVSLSFSLNPFSTHELSAF